MYKLILHKKASKYYQGLNAKAARRINKAIEKMIESPFEGPHIKKLRGSLEGTDETDQIDDINEIDQISVPPLSIKICNPEVIELRRFA